MSETCYVGVKSCGCAVAAIVISPETQNDIEETLRKFRSEGLQIWEWPVERVRRELRRCKCEPSAMKLLSQAKEICLARGDKQMADEIEATSSGPRCRICGSDFVVNTLEGMSCNACGANDADE